MQTLSPVLANAKAIGTLQNNEGDVVSFDVKVSDSTSGTTMTFAQEGLPNGLSLNSSSGLVLGAFQLGRRAPLAVSSRSAGAHE